MAGALKRPCSSSSQSSGSQMATNLPVTKKIQRKRSRLSVQECESSAESMSNCLPSENEASSESEFEDHPYSMPKIESTHLRCRPRNTEHLSREKLARPIDDTNWNIVFDITEPKKPICTSKNAVMARRNRQKKKKYIADLESRNAELENENKMLKSMLNRRMEEIASLKRETVNLQNVIRNSTEIGSLLKCIHENTSLQISSSLLKNIPEKSLKDNSNSTVVTNSLNSSSSVHSANEEEALVAAILWGMALHTFCQPYKHCTKQHNQDLK